MSVSPHLMIYIYFSETFSTVNFTICFGVGEIIEQVINTLGWLYKKYAKLAEKEKFIREYNLLA